MKNARCSAMRIAIIGLAICCAASISFGQLCDVSEVLDLWPEDLQTHGRFGHSVAVDGETLVVGAPGRQQVLVYERDNDEWILSATLTEDPEVEEYGQLGTVVAISGDTIVSGNGVVYVFERTGENWQQRTIIFPPSGAEEFGYSVAISDDALIVGAPTTDGNYSRAGAAYIYEDNGEIWLLREQIIADDPPESDFLGQAVAITGDTAMIGAPLLDGELPRVGGVLIYQRTADGWKYQTTLQTDYFSTNRATFGGRLATDGTRLLVGAPYTEGATGLAHVFRRNGAAWQFEALLAADDGVNNDFFADAVAIDGNLALIGARDVGKARGAAYVYRRTASGWSQQEKIIPPDDYGPSQLGRAVALRNRIGFVGGPGANIENSNGVGAVRIIDIACAPLLGDIDGDDDVDFDDFVFLLGAWGPCPVGPDSCPADFDGDGEVDNDDFTALLANWTG